MKSFILSVVLVVLITGLVILNSFCANHVYDAMLGALDAFRRYSRGFMFFSFIIPSKTCFAYGAATVLP